jgi:hypothetical protein
MTKNNKLLDVFMEHAGRAIDKWEQYFGVYECELADLVESGQPLRLLEIGVQNGGSLELWRKFLPPGSVVHGLDIDPRIGTLEFGSPEVRADVADATDSGQVDRLLEDETFDVIIDDGSHRCTDVRRTYELLFSRLKSGGRYIIEDLHCSYYADYGGGLRAPASSIEYLKHLVDGMHADYIDRATVEAAEFEELSTYNRALARIAFYDSIAVITKLKSPKLQPYGRVLGGDDASVQPISAWITTYPIVRLQSLLFSPSAAALFEHALFDELEQKRRQVSLLAKQVADLRTEMEELRGTLAEMRRETRTP